MAYNPILFNTEMVQAIMEGRKTQTRRLMKLKYKENEAGFQILTNKHDGKFAYAEYYDEDETPTRLITPPCMPVSILWVRETWTPFCINKKTCSNAMLGHSDFCYKASPNDCVDKLGCKWHPSIHMPKEAARIFLLVKDVRVERLQDITDADAHSEGVPDIGDYPIKPIYCPRCKGEGLIGGHIGYGYVEVDCPDCRTDVQRFSHLWDSTVKPADRNKYGWAANPWVWVIEFERCEKPGGWC